MSRLAGKVAVVLGAAGKDNMGQAIARRFVREGARVMVAGRQQAPLAKIAAEIGGHYCLCDITRKSDVEALGKATIAAYGRVDIALNCTGWGLLAKLLETTEEELDKLVALQFKGPYFFLQVFAGLMSQSGGGSLITTSSESVYAGLFDHAAYIGTKAGTDAVVRCFANEFGAKGVKVNSISPGVTETPMTADRIAVPGVEAVFLKEYPMGRIGTTEDVANAAVWLASDESFVTGEVLHVSGGLRLRRNPLPWEIEASVVAAMAKK